MKVTTDACLFGAWVADDIKSKVDQPQHALDIGAGTGLLSLMIAQKNPALFIDAIEIDPGAAIQANENILASPWQNQLKIIEGDIRNFPTDYSFDILISNPPFYENELNSLHPKKNLAHHSSELAFDDLLSKTNTHLNQTGTFYLLLPYKREAEIKKSLASYKLNISKEVYVRQSINHDFFRVMIAGKKEKEPHTEKSEISIWNEKRHYTDEFIKYLEDYYLYL